VVFFVIFFGAFLIGYVTVLLSPFRDNRRLDRKREHLAAGSRDL
jgi:acyl-CoA synthetase (AMP-forming)/AMP-acid ligase II